MVIYRIAATTLSGMCVDMLHSFTKDWSRWSAAERWSVKIAGAGLLAVLAVQIGSHLV